MNQDLSVVSYRPHPDVVARQLGEGVVLVQLSSNRIFELNPTGAAIWDLVTAGASTDRMVAALCEQFDIAPASARREIDALVSRLQAEGLIQS